MTGGPRLIGLRDQRGQRDQSEQSGRREESGDDLGRLTSGLGAAAAVSRRPTPTLPAATTVLGSVKTAIPAADGGIGNGIAVTAVNVQSVQSVQSVQIVQIVQSVQTVETVETVETADVVTSMTDLHAVTCSKTDPDVAVARIDLIAQIVVIVEKEESGREALHPPGARSLHQT